MWLIQPPPSGPPLGPRLPEVSSLFSVTSTQTSQRRVICVTLAHRSLIYTETLTSDDIEQLEGSAR